ncbi:hypothetical protein HYX19_04700 [Candidatus Woesearchaeota archaeon]|nr:hypothetical protein [Candidatus Woesearchaeota archaeon]MBI2673535.1 hypothetical protein [Candidatus Woesearchaeota archaeon]
MKKAQTEILGLLVIVILFIILGVVYLRFSGSPTSEQPTIRQNIEVVNLVNAIRKFTPDTTTRPPTSIRDQIRNCNDESCRQNTNQEIRRILDAAVDKKTTYSFVIKKDNQEWPKVESSGGCIGNLQYVYNSPDPKYTITLKLCRR